MPGLPLGAAEATPATLIRMSMESEQLEQVPPQVT